MSPIELGNAAETKSKNFGEKAAASEKKNEAKEKNEPKEKKEPKITREQRVQSAFDAGKPFTFEGKKKVQKFKCVCGAMGQNAIVLKDRNGKEVLIGGTCVKKFGVSVPKAGVSGRKVDL